MVVKHFVEKEPGLVLFRIAGRRGALNVDPASLPLTGTVILDPPTAETGQCGRATFADPESSCKSNGRRVVCTTRGAAVP